MPQFESFEKVRIFGAKNGPLGFDLKWVLGDFCFFTKVDVVLVGLRWRR